jgi:hypothetical protein
MKGNKMRPTTTLRKAQLLASLAAVSAFAIAPMAAQADGMSIGSDATGTLNGGSLTNTAPTFGAFTVGLTGVAQDVYAPVRAWNVIDATGSNLGWNVTVTATAPVVNISGTNTAINGGYGHGGSMTLNAIPLTATGGNQATAPSAASGAGVLDPLIAYKIDAAAAGNGQGSWHSTADTGPAGPSSSNNSLDVVIPGDASAGDFLSTVTFTSATAP